ncbi:fructosamine kinase family protein [Bacterioplanoides sp.]|uniref:fructosamine kinase family protein n=1 Tax=Bacterioplanoides sp. TaxID=2066072 RepID=UPI003B00BB3E
MNTSVAHQYDQEEVGSSMVMDILQHAVAHHHLFPQALDVSGYSYHCEANQITVQTAAGAYFIKCRPLADHPQSQAEQQSLQRIIQTQTLATCTPLTSGTLEGENNTLSYLILQHLPMAMHGDWFSAGQQLAQMHQCTSEQGYGFDITTYCGQTAQDNRWNSSWADFFVKQRLLPLIQQLQQKNIHFQNTDDCLAHCHQQLSGHQPAAALLHGDLWSGNIGFNPDKSLAYPMIFDPASYYGDGETDLAMTELFGRFPKKFYDGYHSVIASQDGQAKRKPIYQLYHVLNHALLFGEHYIDQATWLMQEIRG